MKIGDLISLLSSRTELHEVSSELEIAGLLTPDDVADWRGRIESTPEGKAWLLFVAKPSILRRLFTEAEFIKASIKSVKVVPVVPPSVLSMVKKEGMPCILIPDFDKTFAEILKLLAPPEHSSLSAEYFVDYDEALKRGWLEVLGDPSSVDAQGVLFGPWVVLEENVKIGEGSVIYPFTFIGRGAQLGRGVVVYSHVYIGYSVKIGDGSIVRNGVTVFPRSVIGKNVEIHEGTAVGSQALAFYPDSQGRRHKIPQIGYAELSDDVEVLSNTVIERGGVTRTKVGRGTKIGNLAIIGHNSRVGNDCVFVGGTMMAGSTKVGDRVITGGQVGIADHTEITSDVMIGGQSGVAGTIREPGIYMFVVPAMKAEKARRTVAAVNRLYEKMKEYDRIIEELKKKGLIG